MANLAFCPWLRASGRIAICVTAVRLSFGAANPGSVSSSRCSRPALGFPNAFDKTSQCSHASHGKPNQADSRVWPAIACRLMPQQLNRPSGRLNAGIGLLSVSGEQRTTSGSSGRRGMSTTRSSHGMVTDNPLAIKNRACLWARKWPPPPATPCSCRRQTLKPAVGRTLGHPNALLWRLSGLTSVGSVSHYTLKHGVLAGRA